MKSTLIFLGLSAVAFAHKGIKSKLAEQAACQCSIPAGSTGVGLPALGQAVYNGFSQGYDPQPDDDDHRPTGG